MTTRGGDVTPARATIPPARDADDRLDRLRLARTSGVGPRNFAELLRRYDNAAAALRALPALTRAAGRRPPQIASEAAVLDEYARGERFGARLATIGDDDYPPGLAAIDAPPPIVWITGAQAALEAATIAIVGARNASAAATRFVREMAGDLARAGVCVVSGLARGVDAAAHEGALSAEAGMTVAAVAGGVDVVYPAEHADLSRRIAERGALIAEAPMGLQPQAKHFPRRNRLISGLSRGVVVVEARERSGSLITARYALEQGRDVMAVPGWPDDSRARGGNRLIRDGATLVESAADVLDALGATLTGAWTQPPRRAMPPPQTPPVMARAPTAPPASADDGADDPLLSLIGASAVEVDALARESGVSAQALAARLLDLEMVGAIVRLPGQRVRRS